MFKNPEVTGTRIRMLVKVALCGGFLNMFKKRAYATAEERKCGVCGVNDPNGAVNMNGPVRTNDPGVTGRNCTVNMNGD